MGESLGGRLMSIQGEEWNRATNKACLLAALLMNVSSVVFKWHRVMVPWLPAVSHLRKKTALL